MENYQVCSAVYRVQKIIRIISAFVTVHSVRRRGTFFTLQTNCVKSNLRPLRSDVCTSTFLQRAAMLALQALY